MEAKIDTSLQLDDMDLIIHLKKINSPFLPRIIEVYDEVKDILNSRVQFVFPNFTMHNTDHSLRIMQHMSKIVDDINKLGQLEIVLLVYSALLHDIGMAVSKEDINLIKADNFPHSEVKFSSMKKLTNNNETLALQELVRKIHASLSAKFIREELTDKFDIPKLLNLDFTNELATICESHTEDYDWIKNNLRIKEVKGDYTFNPQYIACVLRLADILDFDGNRAPLSLYKLISPEGFSNDEWRQHFVISNSNKVIYNEKTHQKNVVFFGKCKNASIHRKILTYIGWVKEELSNSCELVTNMPEQYNLNFNTNPEINIQTEGYTFSDYKMTLQFKAISSLLMGEKIYGNKSLGLRELIQNSIDSCKLRQEAESINHEFGHDTYVPRIRVILDEERNQAIVRDNGTGMSLDIIKKHFLNIGVSYYNSDNFLLKDFEYKPIGNFGIGFLSCFMLSKDVKVITRFYKSKDKYLIELEQGNEYTSLTKYEDVIFDGTEVILNLRNFMEVFDCKFDKVCDFLKQYFLTDGVELELFEKSKMNKIEIINKIEFEGTLEKGFIRIDLSKYLNEIEGYVLVKRKKPFIKNFSEINFLGDLYSYDEEKGIQDISDYSNLNIDDYINGKELRYLSIPIVDENLEEDYLSGMKFTNDDVSEVITKLKRELSWISVIVSKDHQEYLSSTTVGLDDYVFYNFGFEDLVKMGHSNKCKIETSVEVINLFEGQLNKLYLPFDKKERDIHFNYWRTSHNRRIELFMRSVLIKDFYLNIPVSASIFEIQEVVVNINSRKFIPDISRNNVDNKTRDIINYVIGKAIHQAIVPALELNSDEKFTIDNFIKVFYDKRTEFEK